MEHNLFVRPSGKKAGSFGVYMNIEVNRATELFTSTLTGVDGREECSKRMSYMHKIMNDKELSLYVLSIVNSEGYGDGTESDVQIFEDFSSMASKAYYYYREYWKRLENMGEDSDDNGSTFLNEDHFISELANEQYVVIQFHDYHVQFEYSKKKL